MGMRISGVSQRSIFFESTARLLRDATNWRGRNRASLSSEFQRTKLGIPYNGLGSHIAGSPFERIEPLNQICGSIALTFASSEYEKAAADSTGLTNPASFLVERLMNAFFQVSQSFSPNYLLPNVLRYGVRPLGLMLSGGIQIGALELIEGEHSSTLMKIENNLLLGFAGEEIAKADGAWPNSSHPSLGAIARIKFFGSLYEPVKHLMENLNKFFLLDPGNPIAEELFPEWVEYVNSRPRQELVSRTNPLVQGELNLSIIAAYIIFALEQHFNVPTNRVFWSLPGSNGFGGQWSSSPIIRDYFDDQADAEVERQ